MPEEWNPAQATPRQIELVASLASTLGARGNVAFQRGVLATLAEFWPTLTLDVHGLNGEPLAELVRKLPAPVVQAPPSETATFTARCSTVQTFKGDHAFLGYIPGGSEDAEKARQVALFSTREALLALGSNNPSRPLWRYEFYEHRPRVVGKDHIAFAEGRAIVFADGWIFGLDRENGSVQWSWEALDGPVEAITTESGVVLALVMPKNGDPILQALDAHTGVELWNMRMIDRDLVDKLPLCGAGKMSSCRT